MIHFGFTFASQLYAIACFISHFLLVRDGNKAFDLCNNHCEQGENCCEDESEKIKIIILADAIIEPDAVVVKAFSTLVARPAMLRAFLDSKLTDLAIKFILTELFIEISVLLLHFQLNANQWILDIYDRSLKSVEENEDEGYKAQYAHYNR